MKYAKQITDLIGKTPLLKIDKLHKQNANIFAKLEMFNPLSSVKDRLGKALIESAEKKKLIKKNTILIEPTSGNTGIGLAYIAASKGYKLTLVMPESMSMERRMLLKALGAELILTKAELGMKGAIAKATELAESNKNYLMLQQFDNLVNKAMHKKTTAKEIIEDLDGKIDYFIAGVGTGGTLSGVGEALKALNPNIQIIAVEPKTSPVLSTGVAGPHKIQGIGAGFVPKNYNPKVVDEIITVDDETAGKFARKSAKELGLLIGISSGAALSVAVKIAARKEAKNKNIVVLLPDSGERYLSTWLFQEDN